MKGIEFRILSELKKIPRTTRTLIRKCGWGRKEIESAIGLLVLRGFAIHHKQFITITTDGVIALEKTKTPAMVRHSAMPCPGNRNENCLLNEDCQLIAARNGWHTWCCDGCPLSKGE